MNLIANLLKKSQISFTVVNIKHKNGFHLLCSAMREKTRTKMAIFHLCALEKQTSWQLSTPPCPDKIYD
jgi:hypothetical protein